MFADFLICAAPSVTITPGNNDEIMAATILIIIELADPVTRSNILMLLHLIYLHRC